jgi:FkbM family methyltransferase
MRGRFSPSRLSDAIMLKRRLTQIRKAFVLALHPVFRRGLCHGIGATIEHRDLLSTLSPRTVVDVGANIGQFTLLSRGLFPTARIFAFEPLVRPASRYRGLFDGDAQVRFFQAAVAPTAERRQMHVSAHDDSSSLLPISQQQVDFAPGTQEAGREEVVLGPLNQFVSATDIVSPALLKLDVQGFELEALKGCEILLPRFDHIYVEVSFFPLYEGQVLAAELIEWLAARDFHVCGGGNPSYGKDQRIVQMDMLFVRAGA